jgi:hypothetical protein
MKPASSEPHARAHPGAIVATWAWQWLLAAIAAWPAASLVRAVLGTDPRGDAPLWEPGGASLLDLLWHSTSGLVAAGDGAALVLVVGALSGLIPLGLLMTAMARPRRKAALPHTVFACARALPTFAKCELAVLGVQGVVLALGVFVAALAEGWTRAGLGEEPAQAWKVAALVPFLAAMLALGVAHDLARSFVVMRDARWVAGLGGGLRLLFAQPVRLGWSWTWRAVASLVPIGLAAMVAGHAGAGVGGFVAVGAAHQGAIFARVALRASWLARAMRSAGQAAASDL